MYEKNDNLLNKSNKFNEFQVIQRNLSIN